MLFEKTAKIFPAESNIVRGIFQRKLFRIMSVSYTHLDVYKRQDQWPGGQNLMTTPVIWKKVFEILDSDYLGINYDPSHFVWQMMDYILSLIHIFYDL